MTNHKNIGAEAESEENKPLFLLGVVRIGYQKSVVVIENRLGFFKRDIVFF